MISKLSANKFSVDFESAKRWMIAQEMSGADLNQFWLFPGGYSVVVTFTCNPDGVFKVSDFCPPKDSDRWFGVVKGHEPQTVCGHIGGNKLGGYVGVSRGDDGYHFGTPATPKNAMGEFMPPHSAVMVTALESAMEKEKYSKAVGQEAEEEFQKLIANPMSHPPQYWWGDTLDEEGEEILSVYLGESYRDDSTQVTYDARFTTPEGVRYGQVFQANVTMESPASAGYMLYKPGTWEPDEPGWLGRGEFRIFHKGDKMFSLLRGEEFQTEE